MSSPVLKRARIIPPLAVHTWFENQVGLYSANDTIPALDGLRGVAVLLVVVYHILKYLPYAAAENSALLEWVQQTENTWGFGRTGVHLFFVLSGFLLFLPYARTLLGLKPRPSRACYALSTMSERAYLSRKITNGG